MPGAVSHHRLARRHRGNAKKKYRRRSIAPRARVSMEKNANAGGARVSMEKNANAGAVHSTAIRHVWRLHEFRANLKSHSDADVQASIAYGKRMKIYPLA